MIQRIQELDKNMRFEELRKILEYYGYRMGGLPVEAVTKLSVSLAAIPSPSPCTDPIKRAYVEMVKNVVESEENDDEND